TQLAFVQRYYAEHVAPLLNTATLRPGAGSFLEGRGSYFVCRIQRKGTSRLMLVNLPSAQVGRFIKLPSTRGRTDLIFLDDVVRSCAHLLFAGHRVVECHSIKLSRDAELHLEEEFTGTLKDKVRKGLGKRKTGVPARLLYDAAMPRKTLRVLRRSLGSRKGDLVRGGRYHNLSDLHSLTAQGRKGLQGRPWPPLNVPASMRGEHLFKALKRRDVLLHPPYQDFSLFTAWLLAAAKDKSVEHIRITLYRVADQSEVCDALLLALKNGKKVTVFIEVKARFDEGINLKWGETLEKNGAQVHYGHEHVKVHCKLCLIERKEPGGLRRYAYIGTGNFNERTSRIYSDSALITANESITQEVVGVFQFIRDLRQRTRYERLLVAPGSLRHGLEELIDKEIESASLGKEASIFLKLNSLEDRGLIKKLYDASCAGVRIRIIVRSICCLVPGVRNQSENIEAISIVDRYLEHARVYAFHHGGDKRVYLSSADWMTRNLDRRVEVAVPLLDKNTMGEVLDLMEIQWKDRTKARIIDKKQSNGRHAAVRTSPAGRAQLDS
ncbi:MAG TPA: polyphosphate kinase 1, partial [Flavobacteriales bacterium]|nr:polyphosphate kinase 1 [Flavobacteriales bacterium]